MKSQRSSCAPRSWRKRIAGDSRLEAGERDVVDLEQQRPPGLEAGGDQILDDLLLAVDGDVRPPVSEGKSIRWRSPSNCSSMPSWTSPSRPSRSPTPDLAQQVDRPLLEHARADPLLDVLAAAASSTTESMPSQVQQVREDEPGRPGADDADLGVCFSGPDLPGRLHDRLELRHLLITRDEVALDG